MPAKCTSEVTMRQPDLQPVLCVPLHRALRSR